MDEYCLGMHTETLWGETDNRLTATCQSDEDNSIYHWDDLDVAYDMTFCDRGNKLYDIAEHYEEQNDPPDGVWGENENQNIEPFEDRNCNGI
jgi:hypothetical protein